MVGRYKTHTMGSACEWGIKTYMYLLSMFVSLVLQSSFEDTRERESPCSLTNAGKLSEVLSSHTTGVFLCNCNEWNTRRQPDFLVLVFYAEL